MSLLKAVCFLFLCSFLIKNVLCDKQREEDKNMFTSHVARVNAFPCAKPQPRVVFLDELVFKDQIPNGSSVRINPQSTILHRCERTGCCKNKFEICGPEKQEQVTLVFGVFATSGRNRLKFLKVEATNHTSCACQDSNNTPK